ncbi:MAG: flagellar hook-associated protein FlgK [Campylobacterota bacterium]|nr:flagellar hook-associated protein FlgK [Campylobacterota bacterium]
MASIFNALNIGYTGLNAAQIGINTTGHNISNAETEGYTRQRVITSASTPLYTNAGNVGNGTEIMDIQRVFDNFVFDRYTSISADKEFSDFEKKTLEELSAYFPEIDGVGIKSDLTEYYDMWQTFADNPDNDAIKVALAEQTETLSAHIIQTQNQIQSLQSQINEELAVNINQVNELAEELAGLNIAIDVAEADGVGYTANDLRDKRSVIERSLARLIGSDVNQGQLTANIQIDSSSNTRTGSYTLSVNGFNIVDGNTFHPLHITKENSALGFYEVSYERQDGVLIPMEENINSGKVGAIFELRGGALDTTSGMPTDGVLQNVISQFDAFAKGFIEATNNLYAASATTRMDSNVEVSSEAIPLVNSNFNINEGSFNIIVYDLDGNEVATREINIDAITSMIGVGSIDEQVSAIVDDNDDGNANNDIDDFIQFSFLPAVNGQASFSMKAPFDSQGYTFAITDNLPTDDYSSGTNFAGALGLGRFLDGDDASNINLKLELRENPTKMSAGYSGTAGDNRVALSMVQQQFESYEFYVGDQTFDATVYGMFDITATYVGTKTNSAITRNETVSTQFNATQMEYYSVSKVSIDEELTNLIKYQTSYGAAAKVITTIDQMMQTLLGIKQ